MYALKAIIITFLFFLCFKPLSSRDPFTFAITKKQNIQQQAPAETTSLSKWNIKDIGNGRLIVENNDNGQMRTIDISSFDNK